MASPQKENGYTAIANEILEALPRFQMSGIDRRVLDVIFRKTYGFQKRQDKISLSQFVLATGIPKRNICRALKRLITMNIILKIENGDITIYRFNKDFDNWKPYSKMTPILKIENDHTQKRERPYSKMTHTKETLTKETLTKEILHSEPSSQGKEINELISFFKEVNPSYEKFYKNKTQRSALQRLLKKYGKESVAGFIKYLPVINADRYATGKSITPLQLEDNLAHIANHNKQKQGERVIII